MYLLRKSDSRYLPDAQLFTECRGSERRNLSRLGTVISVVEGTTVIPEGRSGKEFFVVRDGEATCTAKGNHRADFQRGDFFGEMALLDGGPRTATVVAKTRMDLVVYSSVEFRTMLDISTGVRTRLLLEIARRLRVADEAA